MAPEDPVAGRVVGLDLGERRIGVAVSDARRALASPRTVIERSGDAERDRDQIAALVAEEGASEVVVGLPRSLSGAIGPAARHVLEEVEALRLVLGVPVTTIDERLTTAEALRRRRSIAEATAGARRGASAGAAGGGPRAKAHRARRRPVVDHEAAAILLQAFLDGTAPR